jgi:hypothetical protein
MNNNLILLIGEMSKNNNKNDKLNTPIKSKFKYDYS